MKDSGMEGHEWMNQTVYLPACRSGSAIRLQGIGQPTLAPATGLHAALISQRPELRAVLRHHLGLCYPNKLLRAALPSERPAKQRRRSNRGRESDPEKTRKMGAKGSPGHSPPGLDMAQLKPEKRSKTFLCSPLRARCLSGKQSQVM